MPRYIFTAIAACAAIAGPAVCLAQVLSPLEQPVVSQGGATVTLGDVDAFMQHIPAEKRTGFVNSAERIETMLKDILRTKQLALNASCPAIALGAFNSACVADANPASTYTAGKGTVLATVGSGGEGLGSNEDPSSPGAPYFQTFMGSNYNGTYGYLKVNVTATSLSATCPLSWPMSSARPTGESDAMTRSPRWMTDPK